MLTSEHDALIITQTADVWKVSRDAQTIAVIERAWDDYHWFLFLADAEGELVCHGALRRVAYFKACVRLWVRRCGGNLVRCSTALSMKNFAVRRMYAIR